MTFSLTAAEIAAAVTALFTTVCLPRFAVTKTAREALISALEPLVRDSLEAAVVAGDLDELDGASLRSFAKAITKHMNDRSVYDRVTVTRLPVTLGVRAAAAAFPLVLVMPDWRSVLLIVLGSLAIMAYSGHVKPDPDKAKIGRVPVQSAVSAVLVTMTVVVAAVT